MRITYFYFGPTEIRALLLLGNVLTLAGGVVVLPWLPPLPGAGGITLHDFFIVLLSLAGLTTIVNVAIDDGRVLAAEDPPPAARPEDELPDLL
jgi:hypothetical protein